MIPRAQADPPMAELTEQLLNMEPVEDPSSNLFMQQPIRMRQSTSSSPGGSIHELINVKPASSLPLELQVLQAKQWNQTSSTRWAKMLRFRLFWYFELVIRQFPKPGDRVPSSIHSALAALFFLLEEPTMGDLIESGRRNALSNSPVFDNPASGLKISLPPDDPAITDQMEVRREIPTMPGMLSPGMHDH